MTPAAMEEEVRRLRSRNRRKIRRTEERRAMSPALEAQPAERALRYQNVGSAGRRKG